MEPEQETFVETFLKFKKFLPFKHLSTYFL